MEFLSLGIINDAHGLDGTLKIFSYTNNQDIRYKKGNIIFIVDRNNNVVKQLTVSSYSPCGRFDLVKVDEINNLEEALNYKNMEVVVEKRSSDLAKDSYFFSDLIECSVIDEFDKPIGKVIKVEEFPSATTLRCQYLNSSKTYFVPFINEFIIDVDIDKKVIKIKVMKGMLWK